MMMRINATCTGIRIFNCQVRSRHCLRDNTLPSGTRLIFQWIRSATLRSANGYHGMAQPEGNELIRTFKKQGQSRVQARPSDPGISVGLPPLYDAKKQDAIVICQLKRPPPGLLELQGPPHFHRPFIPQGFHNTGLTEPAAVSTPRPTTGSHSSHDDPRAEKCRGTWSDAALTCPY